MEYPKINSLFKREGWYFDEGKKDSQSYKDGKRSFIIGDYAEDTFSNIKKWSVEEKVDGTNIRIFYQDGKVRFGGRTKDAQIPCHLLDYLQKTFGDWNLSRIFPAKENESYPNVILFGEGYGPKIQNGGKYREEPAFILFDIVVDKWWLTRNSVMDIGYKLSIPMVPQLGIMNEEEIIEFVKNKPLSRCSISDQVMEGIIARPEPLVLNRNGSPVMFKLKCKEYK